MALPEHVKYLVIGEKYTPESVFDEDFALVDDDDGGLDDLGYEKNWRKNNVSFCAAF